MGMTMSQHTLKKSLAALLLLIAGTVLAGEIYKWTDAEGNVHYEDRPVGAHVEKLNIASRSTDQAKIRSQVTSRREARQERQAENEDTGLSEEQLRKDAKEDAKSCEKYKATMQRFVTSRRLYREDEKGERVYLDEKQTQDARERVQTKIKEFCKT